MTTLQIEKLNRDDMVSHAVELVDELTVQNQTLKAERRVLWIACSVLITAFFVF